MDMRPTGRAAATLATLVIGHLLIAMVHGAAHTRAGITMGAAANAFIFSVILGGPLVGLLVAVGLRWRTGSAIVSATMAAALVFGFVNHFVIPSQDHVMHVAAPWQTLFAITAVLLAVTEALACGVAARFAAVAPRNPHESSSPDAR